jgi:hypothetical protein
MIELKVILKILTCTKILVYRWHEFLMIPGPSSMHRECCHSWAGSDNSSLLSHLVQSTPPKMHPLTAPELHAVTLSQDIRNSQPINLT